MYVLQPVSPRRQQLLKERRAMVKLANKYPTAMVYRRSPSSRERARLRKERKKLARGK